MKLAAFLQTWQGVLMENRWQRAALAILVVANLLLAVATFSRNTVVVLQPPGLSASAEVARSHASQSYLEAWGLCLAELIGNVTPGNLRFIRETLEPLLSPTVYADVMRVLESQAQQIREDRITLRFQPRLVQFEAVSGKVFITGYSRIAGPAGDAERQTRTYEFVLEIDHYRPLLTWMDTYEGQARTQKVRAQQNLKTQRRANDA